MKNKADKGSIAAGTITNSIIQIINQGGVNLNPQEAQDLEQQYLNWVIQECAGLEWLDQVKQRDEDAPEISLDAVFTALLTTSSKDSDQAQHVSREQIQPYSAVEMLNRESRLVITGAPGSGKSALVNFICICMAGECLQLNQRNLHTLTKPLPNEDGQDQDERQNWDHGAFIPLRIIMRDFASSKFFPAIDEAGETHHLMDFIASNFKKSSLDYLPILNARLRQGEVLLMLDGLDEVPQAGERRKRMLECVEAFQHSHSDVRFLVTARPYAYGQGEWKLRHFQATALAEFTRGQICRFVDRWYSNCAGLDGDVALKGAEKLKRAIFTTPALDELAHRPLLLTLIAFLHSNRYDLPDHRADLYERLLELLIEKWEKARFKVLDANDAKEREQYSLAEYLQVGVDAIRVVLERLAFEAHVTQSEQTGTADIAAEKLSHQLFCLATGGEKQSAPTVDPIAIREYLRDRVGILYQRGGENDLDAVYTFPHRSFQEYLAAAYFRREEKALFDRFPAADSEDWWELAAYLAKTDPDRWREVVVLAGGIRSHKEPGQVWSLLDALVPEPEPDEMLEAEGLWGLRLAAEILAENLKRSELKKKHQKILDRIQHTLPQLLNTSKLNAFERVSAGEYLAKIGDPRQHVLDVDAMQFYQVPEGEFFLGSSDADKLAIENEKQGASLQSVSYHYAIARFPITVAQFRQFVEEADYHPKDAGRLRGLDNTPVVFVTWNDAIAFCDWLTDRWQEKGWLQEGWRVDLPSEPEWEKAARGGLKIPMPFNNNIQPSKLIECLSASLELTDNNMPERLYPWGNEVNEEQLNFNMNISQVSTIGCYPQGRSPYGCEEMSGNVWEWTRSLYEHAYPETEALWQQRNVRSQGGRYVLRGGSFYLNHDRVRCAARVYYNPRRWNHNTGFRVVLSPCL